MFTQIAISTLQYDRLNMGLLRDYIDFHYLCTFAARKKSLCSRFLYYVRVRVPYIQGKRLKAYYLPFAAVFVFARQKVSVLPFEYLCSRFLADNVCQYYLCFWYACKHISSKFNPWFYMQVFVYLCNIEMYIYAVCYDKQKTLWEFRVFSAPLHKRPIFLLFVFSLLFLFWINYRKRKQKRKSRFLPFLLENVRFCRK